MRNGRLAQHCLTDEEISSYIARAGRESKNIVLEAHLAKCAHCREALEDVLRMLHPEPEHAAADGAAPSEAELGKMLALVRQVSRREQSAADRKRRWPLWSLAAAAAVALIAVGLWGFRYISVTRRSEVFYAQAKTILEQDYTGKSPSNLRLALPFTPATSTRAPAERDALRRAEGLFFQALGADGGMAEARLGIAFIYLTDSKFEEARREFQSVLDARSGDAQALLGRGVVQYEESVRASDAVQRGTLLAGAIADFDSVLEKIPGSAEARYDKCRALFESGRHKEALKEIEAYLVLDPGYHLGGRSEAPENQDPGDQFQRGRKGGEPGGARARSPGPGDFSSGGALPDAGRNPRGHAAQPGAGFHGSSSEQSPSRGSALGSTSDGSCL